MVVVVKGPDNVSVITPYHQGVGPIVLVVVANNRVVAALQLVLVRRMYKYEISMLRSTSGYCVCLLLYKIPLMPAAVFSCLVCFIVSEWSMGSIWQLV